MTATPSQARDQVFTLIKDAFENGPVQPYPQIIWEVEQSGNLWNGNEPYIHVSMVHGIGNQATLAWINGKKRYRRQGNILMQIHVPLDYDGDLLGLAEQLNETAEKALFNKVTSGGVEFDSVIAVEIGRNGPWFISNVTAAFRYDEIV